jgi:hypothetical protein
MLSNAVIDALVAHGATAEMIAAAIKADHAESAAAIEAAKAKQKSLEAEKRAKVAAGQQKRRAKQRNANSGHAESRTVTPSKRDISRLASASSASAEVVDLFEARAADQIIEPKPGDIIPPAEGVETRLWREGRTILIAHGIKERPAGDLLGKWLKVVDHAALLAVLQSIDRLPIGGDPIAYINQAVKGQANEQSRASVSGGFPRRGSDHKKSWARFTIERDANESGR